MAKHICHWTAQDARRVGSELYDAKVTIEHIIWLDNVREGGAAQDALEELLDDSTQEELVAIFGKVNADNLEEDRKLDLWKDGVIEIGGWLVMGLFRPPDKENITVGENGKARGWHLAYYQRPCVAWHPHNLHTAIGKCISLAARETRAILKAAEDAARQRREEASHAPV